MSEQRLDFPTADGNHTIYGWFREVPAAPITVLVHGLGGYAHEHQFLNASRALEAAGIAVYRVYLYAGAADARNLMECTVDTHVDDVTTVLQQLRLQYPDRPIALVGHSLGGLVIQRTARELYDMAVLWDPVDVAGCDFATWSDAEWKPEFNMWVMHWGSDVLVSPDMYASCMRGPDQHDLGVPAMVISAGASGLVEACKRYAAAQTGPSELVTIAGADHNFNLEGTEEQLFESTISWIKQHS